MVKKMIPFLLWALLAAYVLLVGWHGLHVSIGPPDDALIELEIYGLKRHLK